MPNLIIIRGPLGIGKSTISKKLAKKLDAKYISIDEVLAEYNLDFCPGEPCIPAKNFIKVNNLILPEIKHALKKGESIIIDGNFYYKEQIDHLIENTGSMSKVFTLKAPLEVCIERDAKRNQPHGEEAAKAVHFLVSKFEFGEVIEVGQDTVDQISDKIFGLI